jgi:predicted PurR-regulated permease PerM
VLAVITGFLDLIPQVGATIAAIILVAVALTVSTPAALGMLVIQLISVPFAAVIKIVLREAGAPRRARMAAMRDR